MSQFEYESIDWSEDWRCRNWIQSPPFYFGNNLYISEVNKIAHTQRLDNPYVMNFGPMSGAEMPKVVGHIGNNAFLGSGSNPFEKVTSSPALELPMAPIASIAGFSGMRINPGWAAPRTMNPALSLEGTGGNNTSKSSLYFGLAKTIAYQSGVAGPGIGNSFMHPILPRNDIYRYFNNSVSSDPADRTLPLVNSTSVAAWHALFAGIRERQLVYRDKNGLVQKIMVPEGKRIALSRFDTEVSDQEMDDPEGGVTMPDGSPGWSGVRFLDDSQLQKLAEECVKQVKQRGPFLNFSEFINRRLSDDALGTMGALQSAIDFDDENPQADSINYNFKNGPDFMLKASQLGDHAFTTPEAAVGSRFAGIPGYVIHHSDPGGKESRRSGVPEQSSGSRALQGREFPLPEHDPIAGAC